MSPSPRLSDEQNNAALARGLEAQRQLLASAIALFAACLPAYAWIAGQAPNSDWMVLSLAAFAIDWGAFYAVIQWLKRDKGVTLQRRLAAQTAGGLLWAVTVCQIGALAANAGPARDALLVMAAAGAGMVMVFASPVLPMLLILAPVAAVGPMWGAVHAGQDQTRLVWGALALGLALSLVLNRTLRRQFVLLAEREALAAEREAALEASRKLATSKSHIVSTLSHDIRNGLQGVIQVLAGAAGANGRAAPTRAQLAAALSAAEDLVVVLNATLDTETAQAGALDFKAEPFDPVRLGRDLVLLSCPQAAAKGLELSFHADDELTERAAGMALADPARGRQILLNLIGNAVKYTLRGRIEVRIERLGESEIRFAVADTGPGLSPSEMEQAFEPFTRVARTGAGIPGAGLGLSLSRHVAALMGGRVEAVSAPGAGSCFSLILPYDAAAAYAAALPEPAVVEASGRALRVLMAESDSLSAAMMRAIFEQLGHQVVQANGGQRAIELCGAGVFDLLVLDSAMPGMDGAAATRAIRALNNPNAASPIIAVIEGDANEARQCLAAGANTVLRRPMTVGAVARAVADATAQPSKGLLQASA